MDFFVAHGGSIAGFLLILALFAVPRITMTAMLIWGALTGGGFIWWIGFIFFPYVVVATEATSSYWETNPALCVCAWIVAFVGTLGESSTAARKANK